LKRNAMLLSQHIS